MPRLIFNNMLVFQLSNLVTWSNSKTAAVNISRSPASMASTRMLMNLASRVDVKVVSREPYFVKFRFAVTVSYRIRESKIAPYRVKIVETDRHCKRAQASTQPVFLDAVLRESR